VQDYVKTHPFSDDVLKQEYEKINKQRGNKEYKFRIFWSKLKTMQKTLQNS